MNPDVFVEPEMITAKIKQAQRVLEREDIDLWLVFLQETSVYREPIIDYLIGQDVTWQSAFLYTRSGEAVAIVGNYDADGFVARGCFSRVTRYTESIRPALIEELKRLNPGRIALNYAADNSPADGLTHGLYLVLHDILSEVNMADRIMSSNAVVRSVRGQKSDEELARLRKAVILTEEAFTQLASEDLLGQSEKQISARVSELADRAGCALSFGTIVNAGTKSAVGHVDPTDAIFEAGDLLHIDLGFQHQGYCADLQRCLYALKPGENDAPADLTHAFDAVAETIQRAFRDLHPGVRGCDIDAAARVYITSCGFEEYQHALGHQLGRAVHDGGALIGPEWARYGESPRWPLEAGLVFTLELEVTVPNVGYASLEEDVVIQKDGAEWLSTPQTQPVLISSR